LIDKTQTKSIKYKKSASRPASKIMPLFCWLIQTLIYCFSLGRPGKQ